MRPFHKTECEKIAQFTAKDFCSLDAMFPVTWQISAADRFAVQLSATEKGTLKRKFVHQSRLG